MDFARFAPKRLYAHMARRGFRGELCSFFFAFTGEFLPGQGEFFGAPVRRGYHVAPVPPSPGSGVAISIHRGRMHATHVHQAGVLEPSEQALFRRSLRGALTSDDGD